jgi:hypothetical protein
MASINRTFLTRLLALLGAGSLTLNLHAADLILKNDLVTATWRAAHGTLQPESLRDAQSGQTLVLRGDLFKLVLASGDSVRAGDFKLVGPVKEEPLPANPVASRFSERLPGRQLIARMISADGNLQLAWCGLLREGSRYLRQEFTFKAEKAGVPIKAIQLLDTPMPGARAAGVVDGSPVITDTAFFGVEHPLAINRVEMGRLRCSLPRGAGLRAGESYTASLVIGFASQGQMRRGFLQYLERERAHPYRPFLHYNSWYDLSYPKYNEKEALNAINAFGRELVVKRGVKMDSFLFDDGWDNNATLWEFDRKNFPDGFTRVRAAAAKFGAEPGIWLSPWGGYARPHDERLKYGREQGFEIRNGNFSLAGPKYYHRFRSVCMNLVAKYGINQFKFDGLGQNTGTGGGGAQRDFDAMLRLVGDLRSLKPDIYINQTTGTWPSPFWLLYVDSTWRGGSDHSFAGQGSWCQKWMTYRDEQTYRNVVKRAPLYPLNSLMLHGIIYARYANHLKKMSDKDFEDQVRAYFGNGTQLQEMYITPTLLDAHDWDALAQAARWSRTHAAVLVDTHWVGGDPGEGQVYGWAAWSPKEGILTLRNPSSTPQSITLEPASVFELPAGAPTHYSVENPFQDQNVTLTQLQAGKETVFNLAPFEVLIIEANPES